MQTFFIVIATLVVLFILLNVYARIKMKGMAKVVDHEKIVTLTDKNFKQQMKGKTMLVDFWAEWCGPCKMMAPILNDVAAELPEEARVGKVNVDHYQMLAQQFSVRNIPTMVLFKDGKEINRFVGVKSKDFLLKQIK